MDRSFVNAAAWAFGLNGIGKMLAFLAQFLLAAWLSTQEYGVYAFVISIVSVLVVLGQLGLSTYVVRFVAYMRATRNWDKLKGSIFIANKLGLISSLIIVCIGELILFFGIIDLDKQLKYSLQIGLLIPPFIVLSRIRDAALRGLKLIASSRISETIVVPGTIILGVVFLKNIINTSPYCALIIHLSAAGFAFSVGSLLLRKSMPVKVIKANRMFDKREVLHVALPLLLAATMQVLSLRIGRLMLGFFMEMSDVGIYNISVQIASITIFALQAVNAIAAPNIAEYYQKGNYRKLKSTVWFASMISTLFSIIFIFVLFLFSEKLLSLFGSDYIAGLIPLWILVAGQFINSIFGLVGLLLTMTGRQNSFFIIMFISLIFNILCNYVLIPVYGMLGAAVSSFIYYIVSNVSMALYVNNKLKLNPTCLNLNIVTWKKEMLNCFGKNRL